MALCKVSKAARDATVLVAFRKEWQPLTTTQAELEDLVIDGMLPD